MRPYRVNGSRSAVSLLLLPRACYKQRSFGRKYMSFESGSVATRLFYVVKGLPKDAVTRFNNHVAPPLKNLGSQSQQGWVGGRHLLDAPITDENAYYGGYLRLALVKAERKVPTSL